MSLHYSGSHWPWMARHGVAPNLLMVFLLVGGLLVSLTIRKEYIPPYEADIVMVTVAYPVPHRKKWSRGWCCRLKNEIRNIEGIIEITSTATQGRCADYGRAGKRLG